MAYLRSAIQSDESVNVRRDESVRSKAARSVCFAEELVTSAFSGDALLRNLEDAAEWEKDDLVREALASPALCRSLSEGLAGLSAAAAPVRDEAGGVL